MHTHTHNVLVIPKVPVYVLWHLTCWAQKVYDFLKCASTSTNIWIDIPQGQTHTHRWRKEKQSSSHLTRKFSRVRPVETLCWVFNTMLQEEEVNTLRSTQMLVWRLAWSEYLHSLHNISSRLETKYWCMMTQQHRAQSNAEKERKLYF